MTKRKRDTVTIIESINSWFEAGKHHTNLSSDQEGSTSNSEQSTAFGVHPGISTPTAERGIPVTLTDRGEEVGHKPPNCHLAHVDSGEIAGRAREVTGRPLDGSRSSTETERGAGDEGEPGQPTLDNRRVIPASTEEGGQPYLTLTGIWKVFKEAGYDVW